MSAALDYAAGGDAGYTGSFVGPQTDGTYGSPVVAPQPADAGGGGAASYSSQILDVFKYGVGAYASLQQQQNMLDYRRWEATGGNLTQQGAARPGQTAGGAGMSQGMLLLIGVVVVALVLHH